MLKDKTSNYNAPEILKAQDLYPYFKDLSSAQNPEILFNDTKLLMFGSNNYLGLTNHVSVKKASKEAIDKYGSGCAGSRFLNGTLDLHIQLEEEIARFLGKEKALVFSTGYQVNLGVIAALVKRNEYIIIDELDHACIIDGARLSYGKMIKYRHNDMADLKSKLSKLEKDRFKLIVVDGVFSMDGDLANLTSIVDLAKQYNANIMVDDAHGVGVLGEKGKGTPNHFGLSEDIDLIMGTFSKSLGSIGGYVSGDKQTINFLKHHARSLMFSASISPANAAAALQSLILIQEHPDLIEQLHTNIDYAQKLLKETGLEIENTPTPIIPIRVGSDKNAYRLTQNLLVDGIFVNPVVTPAVTDGNAIIRFSLMSTHTKSQIEEAIFKIEKHLNLLEIVLPKSFAL